MARGHNSGGFDRGTDQIIGIVAMPIIAVVACYCIWYVGHAQISAFTIAWLKLASKLWAVFPFIAEGGRPYSVYLADILERVDPARLTFWQLVQLCNTAMRPLSIPAVILLGVLDWKVSRGGTAQWFTQVMDFEALVKRQNKLFPITTPVLHLDLLNTNPDQGPWARKADYISFAIQHKLLQTRTGKVITSHRADLVAYKFDTRQAARVFERQLGPLTTDAWPSLMQTKPHLAALATAFGLRLIDKREKADALIDSLAKGFIEGCQRDKPHVIPLTAKLHRDWKRVKAHPKVMDVINSHGFLHVALYALLLKAQDESGVLSPSSFLWLKPVDRTAWYSLHQVRLDVSNIEAGGVYAHYLYEKAYGVRLTTPNVMAAAAALEEHLTEEGWMYMPDGGTYQRTSKSSLEINNEVGTVAPQAGGGGGGGAQPPAARRPTNAPKPPMGVPFKDSKI